MFVGMMNMTRRVFDNKKTYDTDLSTFRKRCFIDKKKFYKHMDTWTLIYIELAIIVHLLFYTSLRLRSHFIQFAFSDSTRFFLLEVECMECVSPFESMHERTICSFDELVLGRWTCTSLFYPFVLDKWNNSIFSLMSYYGCGYRT